MLQGPMGPFFERLAGTLRAHGQQVWKVNFNAGDDWFFRGDKVFQFRDPLDQWPACLRKLMSELRLDAIVLFGQSPGSLDSEKSTKATPQLSVAN